MTAAPASPIAPSPALAARLTTFLDLIKFAHSIFAMPFALIATVWALRVINPALTLDAPHLLSLLGRVLLIVVCMVIARTWAMTANRLFDRHFDALNPRTAKRPSVTGAVSIPFMKATLTLCIIFFLATTSLFYIFFQNPWPLLLALPVLAWLAGYSLTKRFTPLCHFWLGLSLGLAPLSAWLAIAPPTAPPFNRQGVTILLLSLGVMFWVAGFDILYAMQDETIDRDQRLHSLPAAMGRTGALYVSRTAHLFAAALFLAVGIHGHFHLLYWIGFAATVILLVVEQSLVSPKDISKINIAFMTANGLIGLTFGVLAIADMLLNWNA